MKLTIIVIGDEILIGQVTDTNSGEIARALAPMGWDLVETHVVGDDAAAISRAISDAMDKSDLVITTGGLGPTKDDITKRVLTDYFGGELVMDQSVLSNVERVFEKRGLEMNDLTCAQALVPTSCRVIQNELGTAPIMWFECSGKVLIAMPGVPFETVGMLHRKVLGEIKDHFESDITILHHTFMVTGITESNLAIKLQQWESALPPYLHLAYLPKPGLIRLRLDGRHSDAAFIGAEMARAVAELKPLLGELMIFDGDATPAEILLAKLAARGLTVASAESCTGGNIAHEITSVAGCSDRYMGSVVSYSNDVKHRVLGVSEADLAQYGAVSEPVVRQMAEGAARAIGTDCSMATSGIAGPGGGSPDKPVGTVWMAIHTPDGTRTRCYRFPGDRARVIDRATTTALLWLAENL